MTKPEEATEGAHAVPGRAHHASHVAQQRARKVALPQPPTRAHVPQLVAPWASAQAAADSERVATWSGDGGGGGGGGGRAMGLGRRLPQSGSAAMARFITSM
jgi:hypothetical protein